MYEYRYLGRKNKKNTNQTKLKKTEFASSLGVTPNYVYLLVSDKQPNAPKLSLY